MSKSSRRQVRRRKKQLAQLPPLVRDGRVIPPELAVFLPAEDPICHVTSRELLEYLALGLVQIEVGVTHASFVLDLLGGLHETILYDEEPGVSIFDVADDHAALLEGFPLPMALVYVERAAMFPIDARARWNALQKFHGPRSTLVDYLFVAPDDHIVWSCAREFGPDAFSSEMAERCAIDVQAAEIRAALGIDDA